MKISVSFESMLLQMYFSMNMSKYILELVYQSKCPFGMNMSVKNELLYEYVSPNVLQYEYVSPNIL